MYNVLLVDNEPAILSALSHAIDWAAHDCHILNIARDGREAMLQFAQEAPDIVISDIRMPEVDGLELARWISENHPACKVIILTGFPDFSYAQQAINYRVVDFVLKPTSEDSLLAALDKAKQRLAEDQVRKTDKQADVLACELFLHQLIFDPVQSLLYTMERTNALGLDLSSCYVLRFGLDDIHTEADRIAFQNEVREMWRQAMGEYTVYFIPRGERFCYIILCAPVGFDPTEACHQVVQTVLSDLHASRITEELRTIQSALENRNRGAVISGLDRLFAYLRREAIPFPSVRRIAVILYECGQGLLISYNLEILLTDASLASERALLDSGAIDDIEQLLRGYLTAVLDRICMNATDLDDLVFRVKQYIDQNYAGELSLEGLADYVHLSASYLSKLFKREVGQNISGYIQQVRIERAKVLLRTTAMKTYEIAEAVGIPDPVYFSKLFKKATGQKPKDFRSEEEK